MHDSLRGLKILDLTSYLSGPFATMTLAGLGAEVWKVERRDGGDPAREFPPFCGPSGNALKRTDSPQDESIAILKRNRGKKSITLNLEDPAGRDILCELAKKADVLIENLAPGVMEGWGLSTEVLHGVNQRLVICSISGYGRNGPKSHLPAFDPIVQASALTMATNGPIGGVPCRTGISFGDTVPSLYAVIGILAALRDRDLTGKGRVVDIAMHDSLVAMLMVEPVEAQEAWGFPLRTGSRIPRLAPCNVYTCQDGYVALNAAPPRLWKRLARLMGKVELQSPELVPLAARLDRQDWLDAQVAEWAGTFTVSDLLVATTAAGVPCARVAEKIEEIVTDEHAVSRKLLQPLEHPELGVMPGLYAPVVPIFDGGNVGVALSRAPRLGEHTQELLAQELGMDAASIAALEQRKIV
jgi:CoA:oxalate CoA-transferase